MDFNDFLDGMSNMIDKLRKNETESESEPENNASDDIADATAVDTVVSAVADVTENSEPEQTSPAGEVYRSEDVKKMIDEAVKNSRPVVDPLALQSAGAGVSDWTKAKDDKAFTEGYEKHFGLAGATAGTDVVTNYTN